MALSIKERRGLLSSCRLSIKACFCPSEIPIAFFCGLCSGVRAGDFTATVCERAGTLLSMEFLFFFTRFGAMMGYKSRRKVALVKEQGSKALIAGSEMMLQELREH